MDTDKKPSVLSFTSKEAASRNSATAVVALRRSSAPEASSPLANHLFYGVGLAVVWALRYSRGETHDELLTMMVRRFGGYVTYAVVYSAMRGARQVSRLAVGGS